MDIHERLAQIQQRERAFLVECATRAEFLLAVYSGVQGEVVVGRVDGRGRPDFRGGARRWRTGGRSLVLDGANPDGRIYSFSLKPETIRRGAKNPAEMDAWRMFAQDWGSLKEAAEAYLDNREADVSRCEGMSELSHIVSSLSADGVHRLVERAHELQTPDVGGLGRTLYD